MDKEEQFDWFADEDLPFMDNKTTDMLDLDPHSYEDEINEADYIRTMSQACRDPNMDAEILESLVCVFPDIPYRNPHYREVLAGKILLELGDHFGSRHLLNENQEAKLKKTLEEIVNEQSQHRGLGR